MTGDTVSVEPGFQSRAEKELKWKERDHLQIRNVYSSHPTFSPIPPIWHEVLEVSANDRERLAGFTQQRFWPCTAQKP